jgi:hypothetical protein
MNYYVNNVSNINTIQYVGQYVNNVFNIIRENYPSLEIKIVSDDKEISIQEISRRIIILYYNSSNLLVTRIKQHP